MTVLGIVFALATAMDPQGSLYNVRLLPLWFISVYLMAAWAFGTWCVIVATAWRRARDRRWEAAEASPWFDGPPPSRPWDESSPVGTATVAGGGAPRHGVGARLPSAAPSLGSSE